MIEAIRRGLTRLGELTATPAAFGIFIVYMCLWAIFDRESLNWHGLATAITWAMTLFIQRAEHRDTQALHGKLDELLRAQGKATTELTHLDREQPEEIEQHRQEMNRSQ